MSNPNLPMDATKSSPPHESEYSDLKTATYGSSIMIPAIDKNGNLYPIEKIKAHLDGIHHLALSVFVFDGDELLIQRRALSKYHCGGLWANTCCSHPFIDEDIAKAAERRLDEELGFTLTLQNAGVVEYTADVGGGMRESERVHMFIAQISKQRVTPVPNPEEVCELKWISLDELERDIRKFPEKYSPWLRIYAQRFPGLKSFPQKPLSN